MLPCRAWRFSRSPAGIDRARKKLNEYLGRVVVALGGRVIYHPKIKFLEPMIFRSDGVHLSTEGNDLFLYDMQQGLGEALKDGGGGAKR